MTGLNFTEEEVAEARKRMGYRALIPDKTASMVDPHGALSISEPVLLSNILREATVRGYLHYHTHDSRKSDFGWPDLVLARVAQPMRLIFAELKAEDGELTVFQERWLNVLAANPEIEVYLWRPHHWPYILEVLNAVRWPAYLAGDDTGCWKVT